uniref:Helentron 4 helitron-like transposon replicase/helicase/endonuclease n=1 Tax=Nothobranchius furzeri TaxID=105023 RepID=A0A1A8UTG2_NOTFU
MEDVTVSGRITRHRSDARVTANAEKQTGETLEEPNTLQNQVKYSCRWIIFISETWINDEKDSDVDLDGYETYIQTESVKKEEEELCMLTGI